MRIKERRRHFFIDKPLQFRYMLTISASLLIVIFVSLLNLYFGIWGGVLDAFSDEKVRNDLLTAARMEEYEQARIPFDPGEPVSLLSLFRQADRLSERQREIFKGLLDQTNRKLIGKLLLLLVLTAWGTVFLSHKIAGPLFRFQKIFESLSQGDLGVRCHLRKFDEARSVAEIFNQTLESLDQSVFRLKALLREEGKGPEERLSKMREELSKFKTSGEA